MNEITKIESGASFTRNYINLLKDLLEDGNRKSPRGLGVRFFQNYVFRVLHPGDVFSTPTRPYRWDYVIKELELYFTGEMSAEKFGEASKFWLKLANPDGNINSNYGNLVFYKKIKNEFGEIANQWTWAKNQLIADKDTRQALIFISSPHVQFEGNKDFICTLNYTFSIFNDELSLEVNRRSQDVILGLPYDYVFEYLLLVKMHNELLEYYPDLKIGSYTMFCNNIHLYDNKVELAQNMINEYDLSKIEYHDILKNLPDEILSRYVYNPFFGSSSENRIFILEGCDRTGKSTFANNLAKALKNLGRKPVIYHMSGPSRLNKNFEYSSDDKSLIQMTKFDEDFNMMKALLKADKDIVFILDRSQFGEYVWSNLFGREGKYTAFNCSSEFYRRHIDILEQSLYISYKMSDIDELERRITSSSEDKVNFSMMGGTSENVHDTLSRILKRFNELDDFVKNVLKLKWMEIDSSQFKTLDENEAWVNENIQKLIQRN